MSGNFEEELENIKASLKHLGAIEESLVSDNYLESRSVSDLESHQDTEQAYRQMPPSNDWAMKTSSEVDSERSYVNERTLLQCNEIIKEKSNLINRLYNCIEELKGEIQELTASLDYHMQINHELEKELEFYRYSKEPNDNYDIQFLQSEYRLLQEKYDDALNQIRSKDLKNAELNEIIATFKNNVENTPSSIFQSSMQYSMIENTPPKHLPDYSPADDLLSEIARELQMSSSKDILPRVIHLKEYYSHSKEFRKLYKKLAECMIKKIGKSNITGLPTCMSIWKWTSAELESLQQILLLSKCKSIPELLEKLKNR